jgi:glycosyltransferase involved in cell wall biosynthesis
VFLRPTSAFSGLTYVAYEYPVSDSARMKVTFIVCVFPPEREPSAVMAAELAGTLSQQHEIRVICPLPNRPHGVLFPGFKRRWKDTSNDGPIRVERVWTWFASAKGPLWGRVLEGLSFGFTAAWQVLIGPRADVILLETWPLTGQVPVALAAICRRIPVLNYVKDLYPEAAIAAGLMGSKSVLARLLRGVDAWICRTAACNIAISAQMAGVLLARCRRPPRVAVIRDWIDTRVVAPSLAVESWRLEVGLSPEDFVCMFAGTMGRASGVELLAEVADRLRNQDGVKIVCIGDGPGKERLQSERMLRNLSNLYLFPFVPREDVPRVQSAADAMLLTVARGVETSSVPSKVITYWAMGKPVIASVQRNSDIAETILTQGLGEVVSPGDARGLAEAIGRMKDAGEAKRTEIGTRARTLAERDYSVQRGATEFGRLLEMFAGS